MEPKQFLKGETLKWAREFAEYPASQYTITYYFRGVGAGFDVTGSFENGSYKFEVSGAITGACAVGNYAWQAFAEKGGEAIRLDSGDVIIKPGFNQLDADSTIETRSENQVALANIRAVLSNKATEDVAEYSIANRSLKRYTITELLALEQRYMRLVAAERRHAEVKRTGKLFKIHHFRMP